MELVDIGVSKSPVGNGVRVQVPPAAQIKAIDKKVLAYIVGIALGDGNLSSPNKRVTRLRISCDERYPAIAEEIITALKQLLPHNKVSIVRRKHQNCFDISVYSKALDEWMPWKVGQGSKAKQEARVPVWIRKNQLYTEECLRGLIQTDGCIYKDRGYQMVNFVNNSRLLAEDTRDMLSELGYRPKFNLLKLSSGKIKYTVKVSRTVEVARLLQTIGLHKS